MPTHTSESEPIEPRAYHTDEQDGHDDQGFRYADDGADDGEVDRVDTVVRLLYTLLFFLIIRVVEGAIGLIVFFQLVFALVTKSTPNPAITSFARRVVEYGYQIGHYVTYNRDRPPFPFDELPDED